jgi:hypothetical protein
MPLNEMEPSSTDDNGTLADEIQVRRRELIAVARRAIESAWPADAPLPSDLEIPLGELVDAETLFLITGNAPEQLGEDGDDRTRRIYMKPSGFDGASSRKLLNLGTNLKRGFGKYAGWVLRVATLGTLAPWLGALALLSVAAEIWAETEFKATERQAVILWTLYERGINTNEHAVTKHQLLELVNRALAEHNRDKMPMAELAAILPALKTTRCVASDARISEADSNETVWWLNEDVEIDLNDLG